MPGQQTSDLQPSERLRAHASDSHETPGNPVPAPFDKGATVMSQCQWPIAMPFSICPAMNNTGTHVGYAPPSVHHDSDAGETVSSKRSTMDDGYSASGVLI